MGIFKFTERRVAELPLGSGIHRDTEVRGLMVLCHRSCRTWAVQGDVRRQKRLVRSVRVKIGRVGFVSLSEARREARRLMADIQAGVDPTATPEGSGVNLEDALDEHIRTRELRPRTESEYRYHLQKYLKRFRRRAVADISRQECRDLLDDLTRRHGRTTAAAVMRTLRAAINSAMRTDETIARNPVDAVRIPVPPRRQVEELDVADFWRRTEALSPLMRDLSRALLLTGARRATLLNVRREDVDLDRKTLAFTHMKTGGSMVFPMGETLAAIVRARMEADAPLGSEWLWPSQTSKCGHVVEPKQDGVPSPHKLRHSARTLMIAAGVPYAESALLLGQRLPGASGSYVHAQHLTEALRPFAQAYENLILLRAGFFVRPQKNCC